ncbi:MAG: ATP-binding cassette domain-containing protein, partial [Desulfobacterales bacterium]|nr:ATP-binding cassette domain-containing protein [Desulfobacterales bacterium]
LEIAQSSITGLIGPNGAGKTTLFNVITGFLPPDSGKIVFNGKNLARLPAYRIVRRGVSRTFQHLRLITRMTILDNILLAFQGQAGEHLRNIFLFPGRIRKQGRQHQETARELLTFMGIEDKANDLVEDLSYGQQKMVSLACCLASGADVLLLDEPVAGINPETIDKILAVIKKLPAKGKVTAIIGPNGSGKSTALKSIFGLIPVWQGRVAWHGQDVTNRDSQTNVRSGIAFVPQGNQVFDEMTVLENLEIGGLHLSKNRFQKELTKIWALFPELEQRKKQNSGKLSGGEKQMLSLGRALINSPELILMDEPSLGLSPKLVNFMMKHIRKISDEFGVTVLIVEQKVRKVLEISHQVYSIKLGKIAFEGAPEELKQDKAKLNQLFL